jgi:hypothetical protein
VFLGVVLAVVAAGGAGDAAAEFRAATRRGSGACAPGWKLDKLRAECYRCPAGYERTVLPLDAMACERGPVVLPARAVKRGRGTGLIKTDCPKGQFIHFDRFCYSCPAGYIRTGSGIGASDACAKPVAASFEPAQWRAACPAGAFRDFGRGDCWSCPANWHRTAAPVDSPNACSSDLGGILGASPRGVCSDLLAAVEEGGAEVGRLQAAIGNVLSPVTKRLNASLNDVTQAVRTPAAFDKLLAGVDLAPTVNLVLLDDILRFADSAGNAVDRLARAALDPAVVCDGNLARLDRELLALGLRPNRAGDADASAGAAFSLLRRPAGFTGASGGPAQARRSFYSVALEGSAISPYFVKGVVSVSIVTDLAGSGGVLWSFGGAGGAKEPKGVEASLTVLVFPNALLEDFAGFQTLGTQIDVGFGEPAAVLVGKIRGLFRGFAAPVKPSPLVPALAFSFDPVKLATTRQLSFGIGPSWTLLKKSWASKPPSVGGEIGLGGAKPTGIGTVGGEVGVRGAKPTPSPWPSFGVSVDFSVMLPKWGK